MLCGRCVDARLCKNLRRLCESAIGYVELCYVKKKKKKKIKRGGRKYIRYKDFPLVTLNNQLTSFYDEDSCYTSRGVQLVCRKCATCLVGFLFPRASFPFSARSMYLPRVYHLTFLFFFFFFLILSLPVDASLPRVANGISSREETRMRETTRREGCIPRSGVRARWVNSRGRNHRTASRTRVRIRRNF